MRKLHLNLLAIGKILLVFVIFVLFVPIAQAIGTLQKKGYFELSPGQTAEFVVLFWNSDELPTAVELNVKDVPENFIVIVEPKKFVLDKNITSSEVIGVPNVGYVRALPVKVLAKALENAKPGIYDIMVNMVAGETRRGLSFFQEKNFNFRVNVTGYLVERTKEPIGGPVEKVDNYTRSIEELEKTVSQDQTKLAFWIAVIVVILVVSWVVYKT
jgi:hypothetical protein